ncbi:hypothetical protein INR49_003226 [Caranx melampygus]|nr:hypothetical protein INR49_003226 [Caranx melampygus]
MYQRQGGGGGRGGGHEGGGASGEDDSRQDFTWRHLTHFTQRRGGSAADGQRPTLLLLLPSTSIYAPPPPHPATEGRASPADGEEADEEDGDTDDSDESDEELRSYSVQEQSGGEDSEDECHPVPIVVSDDSEAHKLRSLLKKPALLTTESLQEELDCKKKTVSFFDDVTVYLFDQESPTKELTEHGFSLGAEGQSSRSKSHDRVNASDDSSDGNISEESPGHQTAVQFSRFTVSPSNVSRFSITHISDSDMDSAGGSSEDGDKE